MINDKDAQYYLEDENGNLYLPDDQDMVDMIQQDINQQQNLHDNDDIDGDHNNKDIEIGSNLSDELKLPKGGANIDGMNHDEIMRMMEENGLDDINLSGLNVEEDFNQSDMRDANYDINQINDNLRQQ